MVKQRIGYEVSGGLPWREIEELRGNNRFVGSEDSNLPVLPYTANLADVVIVDAGYLRNERDKWAARTGNYAYVVIVEYMGRDYVLNWNEYKFRANAQALGVPAARSFLGDILPAPPWETWPDLPQLPGRLRFPWERMLGG